MRNRRNNRGFTLAELLIVVAIIAILSGVGFVAVQRYQRGMAQLERDAIAKEIFVAAQNHLTMADSQGYLGLGEGAFGQYDEKERVYYYAVTGGDAFGSNSALDLMLPFGSVDETVRAGGSYVIRYNKNPAVVLDVFYCTRSGTRFGHDLTNDYSALIPGLQGANKKGDRRNCLGGAVLGWYGGEAGFQTTYYINTPTVTVKNAERLTVDIAYDMTGIPTNVQGSVSLKLIVTGVNSGAQAAFPLTISTLEKRVKKKDDGSGYTVVLDDVTSPGMHFADINEDSYIDHLGTFSFIPGENVVVKAVAYSNAALTNIAYSSEITVNSLFADIDENQETALIGNFRHLENLDDAVSDVAHSGEEVKITRATQLYDLSAPAEAEEETPGETEQEIVGDDDGEPNADLSWPGFIEAIGGTVQVYAMDKTCTENGCYRPVSPTYALEYDGQGHSVTGVKVNTAGDAGLFGAVTGGSLSNIELIDFDITGTRSAGALAGSLTSTAVTNVVAHSADKTVTASAGPAGGLIGSASGGTVSKSAAAMIVSAGGLIGDAGGLIGKASDRVNVTASYAGGHTNKATYYDDEGDPIINVTGTANAGGLIGDAGNATIDKSYSTCSVRGATAGGLVGTASGGLVGTASGGVSKCYASKCYATGLVTGAAETSTLGAFAGSFTGTATDWATDCQIYGIINEGMASGVSRGVAELDESLETYNAFVGSPDNWQGAKVYDATLTSYFGEDKYSLRTVAQLGVTLEEGDFVKVHYGDWPAPELLVVNTAQ